MGTKEEAIMPTKEEVQRIVQAYRLYTVAYGAKVVGMQEEAASYSERLKELDPTGELQEIFQGMVPEPDNESEKKGREMGMRIGLAIRDQIAKGL
jgi:uncharacterized protein YciW